MSDTQPFVIATIAAANVDQLAFEHVSEKMRHELSEAAEDVPRAMDLVLIAVPGGTGSQFAQEIGRGLRFYDPERR